MESHLDGLPKYGVTLSGSPENPVIENRSCKNGHRLCVQDSGSERSKTDRSGPVDDFRVAGRGDFV